MLSAWTRLHTVHTWRAIAMSRRQSASRLATVSQDTIDCCQSRKTRNKPKPASDEPARRLHHYSAASAFHRLLPLQKKYLGNPAIPGQALRGYSPPQRSRGDRINAENPRSHHETPSFRPRCIRCASGRCDGCCPCRQQPEVRRSCLVLQCVLRQLSLQSQSYRERALQSALSYL